MTRQNFIPSQENEKVGVNGLIPFWDMCNHTNGYLSTQYKSDKSECLACKSFKKGEQVMSFSIFYYFFSIRVLRGATKNVGK